LPTELLLHFDIVSIKESGDASQAQGVLHILLEEKIFYRQATMQQITNRKGFFKVRKYKIFQ
jgi:hypothetical protein